MMRKTAVLTFLVLNYFSCGKSFVLESATVECPVSTREHTSECNKYFRCIKLPSDKLSWITLTCPPGLVYDKNLLTCAIPTDDWDCPLTASAESEDKTDDENVYGVENLEILSDDEDSRQAKDDSDEFLAVIDGDENLPSSHESRKDDEEVSVFSGDGEVAENFVTPSSPTVRMITTQVQRLTQLVNNIAKNTKGVTPDDLNSFLDRQRIQYENFGDPENEKTPLPSNGRIHDEVLTEIINRQSNLKEPTTLPMDKVTTTMRPFEVIDKNPITEIKLKSGVGLDSGSHQIVVNRPEGSVLFNVPASPDHKQPVPYLSADILKTILELSKNLVQKSPPSSQQPINYQPQPVYYAIPVPIYQHQSYYGSHYQNYSQPITTTTTPKPKVEIKNNLQNGYFDSYGNYYYYPQTSANKNYESFNNYPSYNYQQQYGYNPFYNNFYQQYPQNNHYGAQNAAYYEKRPYVIDSSAPSYVDHVQQPFRKESTIPDSGYEASDEESEDDLNDDNLFDEPPPPKDPTDGLICTNVLARQANKTDCFKYYVCNAKTKEVLDYTCPPLTAFNDQTKFCDSNSYKDCKKMQENERKNSVKHRRIVSEAQKMLAQAKREKQKAERITNLMRKQSQKFFFNNQYTQPSNDFYEYQKVYQSTESPIEEVQEEEIQIPVRQTVAQKITRPQVKQKKKKKSKKVKCTNLGAIPDPEDNSSYWHCFKDERDGRIKRIHRKCTGSLKFCAATRFCGAKC